MILRKVILRILQRSVIWEQFEKKEKGGLYLIKAYIGPLRGSGKTSNQFARRQNEVNQDQILWLLVHSLTKKCSKNGQNLKKSQFLQNFGIFFDFFG